MVWDQITMVERDQTISNDLQLRLQAWRAYQWDHLSHLKHPLLNKKSIPTIWQTNQPCRSLWNIWSSLGRRRRQMIVNNYNLLHITLYNLYNRHHINPKFLRMIIKRIVNHTNLSYLTISSYYNHFILINLNSLIIIILQQLAQWHNNPTSKQYILHFVVNIFQSILNLTTLPSTQPTHQTSTLCFSKLTLSKHPNIPTWTYYLVIFG